MVPDDHTVGSLQLDDPPAQSRGGTIDGIMLGRHDVGLLYNVVCSQRVNHRSENAMSTLDQLNGKDRLIVALDVPAVDEALRAVELLSNVNFFKVGLQLFMTGGMPTLLQALSEKQVFVDLKVPGDISNTIAAVVDMCVGYHVTFLTVSESMPPPAIRVAKSAREAKQSHNPRLLTVPFLSSLDAHDLAAVAIGESDLETYVLNRARSALNAGCDGIVASGEAIGWCRLAFPHPTIIVSPGIRPAGASVDDHKRCTTPAQAIRLGADYVVVGRPILKDPHPRDAADRIIHEIDSALDAGGATFASGMDASSVGMYAQPPSE